MSIFPMFFLNFARMDNNPFRVWLRIVAAA